MISDDGNDVFALVGSDDGQTFWSLRGTWTSRAKGEIQIDFSPKGGPAHLAGTVQSNGIRWSEGNFWSKLTSPPVV